MPAPAPDKLDDLPQPGDEDRLTRKVTKYDLWRAASALLLFIPFFFVATVFFDIPQQTAIIYAAPLCIIWTVLDRYIRNKLMKKRMIINNKNKKT
jgi:hypothetical protein